MQEILGPLPYSKGKDLLPLEAIYFPFRKVPFSERDLCVGEQTRIHKSCLPYKIAENESCALKMNE